MSFWERSYNLCLEKNTKPNPLGKELGISSGVITRWKNGGIPNSRTLKLIADYFEVTIDYLLGKTDKKEPTAQNEQLVFEELQKLIEASSSLSDEETLKVLEYVEFLKSQRN